MPHIKSQIAALSIYKPPWSIINRTALRKRKNGRHPILGCGLDLLNSTIDSGRGNFAEQHDYKMEDFMEELLDIIRVVLREDRTLLLTFENNGQRIFDIVPYLGKKPFLKLKSLPLFMKAKAENGHGCLAGQYRHCPGDALGLFKYLLMG